MCMYVVIARRYRWRGMERLRVMTQYAMVNIVVLLCLLTA